MSEQRHTDQDVAIFYSAVHAALAVEHRSWWARWLDFLRPKAAAHRRQAMVSEAYRAWQEARPRVVVDEAPLPMQGTVLARMMVRQSIKRIADEAGA